MLFVFLFRVVLYATFFFALKRTLTNYLKGLVSLGWSGPVSSFWKKNIFFYSQRKRQPLSLCIKDAFLPSDGHIRLDVRLEVSRFLTQEFSEKLRKQIGNLETSNARVFRKGEKINYFPHSNNKILQ